MPLYSNPNRRFISLKAATASRRASPLADQVGDALVEVLVFVT